MNENSFPVLAVKHFDFLSAMHNFTMQENIRVFGKTIIYQSTRLIIQICQDRGSIFVFLRPAGEPEIAQLELSNVFEALSVFVPPGFQGPVAPAQYEKVLEFYARSLRENCNDLLEGDFYEIYHTEKKEKDPFGIPNGKIDDLFVAPFGWSADGKRLWLTVSVLKWDGDSANRYEVGPRQAGMLEFAATGITFTLLATDPHFDYSFEGLPEPKITSQVYQPKFCP